MIRLTDIDELLDVVRYPLPPTVFTKWADEMDVYVRFMRQLRSARYTKVEQKIYSAIQAAAVGSGHSDADVAMILVDLGLRAPRGAFPAEFLEMVDHALCRMGLWGTSLTPVMIDLIERWKGDERTEKSGLPPVPCDDQAIRTGGNPANTVLN